MLQFLKGIVLVVLYSLFSVNLSLNASEVTKKFSYKDFTSVNAGWGMNVKITQAEAYSIEVKGDERDMEYFRAEQDGDKVIFYIDKKSFRSRGQIYIIIKMPELKEIELSAGASGDIAMKTKSDFMGELSAGSSLEGNLECGNIDLNLSAGSSIRLNGKARNMRLDGSAGSICRLKDFPVDNADIDLSAGSTAWINCSGKIDTDQSAGSTLFLAGKGTVARKSLSAGSSIQKD